MNIVVRLRQVATRYPFAIGLVLTVAYFLIFIIPEGFSSRSFGRGRGIEEAADAIDQLPLEIGLVVSLLVIIGMLGWRRQTGLSGEYQGGLWFAAPAMLLSALLLVLAAFLVFQSDGGLFSVISSRTLGSLALMTLLVGFFEEMLFRGVVQYGATELAGAIPGVLIASALFGLMHYVNWVNGQPLAETHLQVFHATTAGILYGALRLRTGLLWPGVLVHAVWDFSVLSIHTVATDVGAATEATAAASTEASAGSLVRLVVLGFEPLLGLFILWRWRVWKKGDRPEHQYD